MSLAIENPFEGCEFIDGTDYEGIIRDHNLDGTPEGDMLVEMATKARANAEAPAKEGAKRLFINLSAELILAALRFIDPAAEVTR
jgi:hypothetical protein